MSHDKLKIGDCVVYSTKGICRITDVEEKVFDRDKRNYFVLVPIFDEMSTYYIPQDYDSESIRRSQKARRLICANMSKPQIRFNG